MNKNDNKQIEKPIFDKAGDFITENPIMRALISLAGLVPVVSALDAAVVAQWEKSKQERFKKLLEELKRGEKYLTEELIQQEDFIYGFVSVTKASINTRRKEKIELFANVLKNACRWKELDSHDFEDNLSVLDEISLQELKLLALFNKHEEILAKKNKNKSDSNNRKDQWKEFIREAEKQLGLPKKYIKSSLSRLARTGLYELALGIVGPNTLGSGYTTEKFDDFIEWIQDEESEIE